jgi:hypothetical protein
MIERMGNPPAWICDMATLDSPFEIGTKLVEHLKLWNADDVFTKWGDLKLSLDFLAHLRGEMPLDGLLQTAATCPHEMLIGEQSAFAELERRYAEAAGDPGAKEIVSKDAIGMFARCFPEAWLYFRMTHESPADIAREIELQGD